LTIYTPRNITKARIMKRLQMCYKATSRSEELPTVSRIVIDDR